MPRANYDKPPAELVRLGAALKELRKRQDLKQIELATAAGMTEGQISTIERGKNNLGWRVLMRHLDGLGLTISDLAEAYERAGDSVRPDA
jgi:transcriptional regulator with XRE-family HTH domain